MPEEVQIWYILIALDFLENETSNKFLFCILIYYSKVIILF